MLASLKTWSIGSELPLIVRDIANARNKTADKREFIKISQAVGVGFVVMGALGYIVKLSTRPFTPEIKGRDVFRNVEDDPFPANSSSDS